MACPKERRPMTPTMIMFAVVVVYACVSTLVSTGSLARLSSLPTSGGESYSPLKNQLATSTRGALSGPAASLTSWSPDDSKAPRFLLGIFSHNLNPQESTRRQVIRETYLQYFRQASSSPNVTATRICPLQDIVSGKLPWRQCQIAYTFVIGRSSHTLSPDKTTVNRTCFLEAQSTKEIQFRSSAQGTEEADVLTLDIEENVEHGKSPTWLRYTALLLQEHPDWTFDYVIKSDSDTLLIPHRFLRWIETREQHLGASVSSDRRRIYGGTPMDKFTCGFPDHDHCSLLKTPVYMGGAFYFVSTDLAHDVSLMENHAATYFMPHEDMFLGNVIHHVTTSANGSQKPFNETVSLFQNPDAYQNMWRHPVKYPKRMKTLWRQMIDKQKKRRQALLREPVPVPSP